jgi:hypothetical protein
MIEAIKAWFLNSKLGTRKKAPTQQFNALKNGLLIWDASDLNIKNDVLQFVKKHSGATLTFKTLGFINQKKLAPELSQSFYGSGQVNWFGQPSGSAVEDTLKQQYDICIFLGNNLWPHQKYILSHVKASIIAGEFIEGYEDFFDFMVSTKTNLKPSDNIKLIITELNKVAWKS